MGKLSSDWVTEKPIDFEYKKYILLAYLQKAGKNFKKKKLYPFLSDLIFHYNNLILIKSNKKKAVKEFPKKVSQLDFAKFKVLYESLINDPAYMQEVEQILDFAIPVVNEQLENGKGLYEFIEDKIDIFPVGVVPLNAENGYMLIRDGKETNTKVYQYCITIFENANERFRGIKTEYIASYKKSYYNTFEQIKLDLLRQSKIVQHPATYAIDSKMEVPLNETLLPIAKRSLVKLTRKYSA